MTCDDCSLQLSCDPRLLPLIQTLFEIVLFRKGPEHIPRSGVLLVVTIALWLVAGLGQIVLIDRGSEAGIVIDIFSALLAVICYTALLIAFGKGERLTQMITAALGCSALLLTVFTFSFLFARLIGSPTLVAVFFWIYLPWAIAVRGHIIARAIDRHWYLGLVFAVLIFVLQYVAVNFLRAP